MVAKALEVLGEDLGGAYDIGCSFQSTILKSDLAAEYKRKNCHFFVNAFHGYTHSYDCQVKNHPNVIEGAGLEDFETLERVFSSSNQLGGLTRWASVFRRQIFVVGHFQQWDSDKYLAMGTFVLNNYRQALDIIARDGASLESTMQALQITDADLDQWEQEEHEYFTTLGKERPWDARRVVYVELLQQLRAADSARANTNTNLNRHVSSLVFVEGSSSSSYSQDAARTRRLETERRTALEKHERLLQEVAAIEVELGIGTRWHPGMQEYRDALQYIAERRYHRALDNLQRLVVQCLFELHKMNISQTGE